MLDDTALMRQPLLPGLDESHMPPFVPERRPGRDAADEHLVCFAVLPPQAVTAATSALTEDLRRRRASTSRCNS